MSGFTRLFERIMRRGIKTLQYKEDSDVESEHSLSCLRIVEKRIKTIRIKKKVMSGPACRVGILSILPTNRGEENQNRQYKEESDVGSCVPDFSTLYRITLLCGIRTATLYYTTLVA